MMKIFKGKSELFYWPDSSLWIEHDPRWIVTNDLKQSEIVPCIYDSDDKLQDQLVFLSHQDITFQTLVLFQIFHIQEYQDNSFYDLIREKYKKHIKNIIVITKNKKANNHLYFDHMFNRQKLYCTEYNENLRLDSRTYTYGCTKNIYKISNPIKTKKYKFLCANRIYGDTKRDRMSYRIRLHEYLKQHRNFGIINDEELLETNETKFRYETIVGGTWFPIADRYYNDTFVSTYVETVTTGTSVDFISEKTFDPLIKGNYILPFGYSGMLKFLVNNYGFILPKWIDYSYDVITDDNQRFQKYLESVDKVLGMSIDEISKRYADDRKIIEHNKQVFYDRSYDNLYDSILFWKNKHL